MEPREATCCHGKNTSSHAFLGNISFNLQMTEGIPKRRGEGLRSRSQLAGGGRVRVCPRPISLPSPCLSSDASWVGWASGSRWKKQGHKGRSWEQWGSPGRVHPFPTADCLWHPCRPSGARPHCSLATEAGRTAGGLGLG